MNDKKIESIDLTAASPSAEEILSYLMKSGIVDLDGVEHEMNKKRREQILKNHPFTIYKGSDGRYRTYVSCEDNERGRKMIVKSSLDKLQDAIIDCYILNDETNRRKAATLESLFEDWIDYKEKHVKAATVKRNRQDWNRYYADEDIVSKPIVQLTKLDIDTFVHYAIRMHKMNKHQFTNFISILRQELDYAVELEIIDRNLLNDVKISRRKVLVPEPKKEDKTQVFTREEASAIKALAWKDFKSKRYYKNQLLPLAVIFLLDTGLRRGEVVAVRYEDVHDNKISIRRFFAHHERLIETGTKGTYGERDVFLIPEAMNIIETARRHQQEAGVDDKSYIFSMNDAPLTYSAVGKIFTKYCNELGIINKSPHKARKTFISAALDAGLNLNTVRRQAGHGDEHTTLNNYYYDRSSDDEQIRKMEVALSG